MRHTPVRPLIIIDFWPLFYWTHNWAAAVAPAPVWSCLEISSRRSDDKVTCLHHLFRMGNRGTRAHLASQHRKWGLLMWEKIREEGKLLGLVRDSGAYIRLIAVWLISLAWDRYITFSRSQKLKLETIRGEFNGKYWPTAPRRGRQGLEYAWVRLSG